MRLLHLLGTAAAIGALATGASAQDQTPPPEYGPNPTLGEPQRGLLPTMKIPRPALWGDDRPVVPEGFTIQPIATDLMIPRQTLILPNGDILVAEGKGQGAPALRPKDLIAGIIKAWGKSSVSGGNRLTLLRDADGDGTYETKEIFAENLNSPYGLAFVNGAIYVANQDTVVRFDYTEGQSQASGPPEVLAQLPSVINHHWTKAMTASEDGRFLYVGIGSNSNITERGMEAEEDRAMIWQIDVETGMHRQYATGLRNPTALTIQPDTGQLWAVVNERDEIGDNLVPDYLTSVQEGGFYGWPYSYWGQNVDVRVQPQDPEKVAAAIAPDYALGSHVAALGVDFSVPAMGEQFADGVFVGEHGSWNRNPPSGYKVIFIPFQDGRPAGEPVDFVTGFLQDADNTRGRPVGVTVDPRGAVIVADDLSNTIWRITPDEPVAATTAPEPVTPAAAEPATPEPVTPATAEPGTSAAAPEPLAPAADEPVGPTAGEPATPDASAPAAPGSAAEPAAGQ
ncbi:Glucose/arabinose dehydrogenase, beta-propeller fold [Paracoccus chinensis]|uniref:Glucose/arabinose dehydrogenase, beta-propeller fold n=2 Tax=Paracoccus chinensis TaxID=525640 RepID=A0A1G9GD89_9RHOB|nr:Glucose/arabinose dehydrogenase, beta-propeller fold [Paracoccus chinensis]